MSGLFKSTVIKGNRLTDFANTSATVGEVIPFGYGRFPVKGNIIWAPLPPKEHRQVKRQGKGGVKQESFTYTLSYSVAFCEGSIFGFWWIKRNGKIVWTNDPNAPVEDLAYANKWRQRATFYYGTATQLPDSTIESYEGSGNVSAFRYLAHVVVEDDDVTDGGGAVPDYEAVPIASPPEVYFTSKPYAQFFEDKASYKIKLTGGELRTILHEAYVDDQSSYKPRLIGGYLGLALISLVEEERSSYLPTLTGGTLKSVLKELTTTEAASYLPTLAGGTLKRVLVELEMPTLQASYSPTLEGGTLE